MTLAREQWEQYCQALRDNGWQTIEVEPAPQCPDSVFVEDSVVVYGDLAVVARSGAPERQEESVGTEKRLRELGYRITRITEPGTLDGGDVLKHEGRIWVGQSSRTNPEGIAQLRQHLAPLGAEVISVPLTKALHLKSAVTALPDGTVIGWQPVVDDPGVWERFRPTPEEPGAHVVLLDERTLLLSAAAERTRAEFEAEGYRVVSVDMSEFEKLEGCVTCLSVRLRSLPNTA